MAKARKKTKAEPTPPAVDSTATYSPPAANPNGVWLQYAPGIVQRPAPCMSEPGIVEKIVIVTRHRWFRSPVIWWREVGYNNEILAPSQPYRSLQACEKTAFAIAKQLGGVPVERVDL